MLNPYPNNTLVHVDNILYRITDCLYGKYTLVDVDDSRWTIKNVSPQDFITQYAAWAYIERKGLTFLPVGSRVSLYKTQFVVGHPFLMRSSVGDDILCYEITCDDLDSAVFENGKTYWQYADFLSRYEQQLPNYTALTDYGGFL